MTIPQTPAAEALLADDLKQLQEALSAEEDLTRGPWRIAAYSNVLDEYDCYIEPLRLHLHDDMKQGDCDLITACDPDRISRLLSHIATLTAERDALKAEVVRLTPGPRGKPHSCDIPGCATCDYTHGL